MANLNRIIVNEMAQANKKAILLHGHIMGEVLPHIEWLKWLSYEPEFEKKRIEYLNSQNESELTIEELEELAKYNKNKLFAKLFKVYGTNECSFDDYLRVYEFMCKESIKKLMLSKLTADELQYAKQEINRLSELSKEQLSSKVKEEQKLEKYTQLSMVDSYILHMIYNIDFARSMNNLSKEIEMNITKNNYMRARSLYYASNPESK